MTFAGALKLYWDPSEDDRVNCALDVADAGPHRLEQVAEFLGTTRERVDQLQFSALRELAENAELKQAREA